MMLEKKSFSFIEDHEIEQAKSEVRKGLAEASGIPDIELPMPGGYWMAVKVYVRPKDVHLLKDDKGSPIVGEDGKPLYIEIPEQVRAEDKYRSCTGLVIAQGPSCYKGDRFKESGPWCRVGDFIMFPRNEGYQVNYRGVVIQVIPDDRMILLLRDPSHITRE